MDEEEEFGEFEATSAANKGAEFFGRQDHLRRAAEQKTAKQAAVQAESGKNLSEKAQAAFTKALREQKATWQTDGLGIRGTASVVSNATANLVWGSSNVTRRANPEIDQGGGEVAAEVPTEPA